MEDEASKNRPHFRESTAAQRQLLFETWEQTEDIDTACCTAHLSRGTFYYWKSRFEQGGYAGIENTGSRAPHNPAQTKPEVVARIVALKEAHRDWGKQRIADELMKSNGWMPLVSAGTVYNILVAKGLIASRHAKRKKKENSRCDMPKKKDKP
jgi:transposase